MKSISIISCSGTAEILFYCQQYYDEGGYWLTAMISLKIRIIQWESSQL